LLLAGFSVVTVAPALAQAPPAPGAPPAVLQITREEVKPGKDAAHEASEASWSAAHAKAQLQNGWLGMTSLSGPNEAWFLQGYASWEEMEKAAKASQANEAYSAEVKRISPIDGDSLSRGSAILANFRPALSYGAGSNLATRRYMQVRLIRVKPGRGREFTDAMREEVAAHEKAKMDDTWAMYQVASGLQDGTYIRLQALTSLAEVDKSGPVHAAATYRDAQSESGRARGRQMNQEAIEWSQTLLFAFNPKMTVAPKAWIDADPFWAPKPAAPAKPAEKKK
jgi:hypothetical protein